MDLQSRAAGDIGLRLHLIGGAGGATNLISSTYQSAVQPTESPLLSPQFYAGRPSRLMITVGAVFDAASAVTDIRFKLQGIPRPEFVTLVPFSTNPWIDILTLDHFGNPGTGANVAEHLYVLATVGAGNGVIDTLMTESANMYAQLQVVAEATGGATKAGDIAYAWVNGV